MNRDVIKTAGVFLLAVGGVITIAGGCMFLAPGPGLPVFVIGLALLGAGGLLVAFR